MDHQIGAKPQHRRLQHHAHDLGDGAVGAGDIGCADLMREMPLVEAAPRAVNALAHAERPDRLGIAAGRFAEGLPSGARGGSIAHRRAAPVSVRIVRATRTTAPATPRNAEPGMQQIDEAQIERDPGQVEQRRGPLAREKAANLVEVANRLQAIAAGSRAQRQQHHGREYAVAQVALDPDADAAHHARAQEVEHAEAGIEQQHDDRETHQRRDAVRRQHPVVELQHVERAGQRQHVDDAREQADAEEGPAAARDRGAKLGWRSGANYVCSRMEALHCRKSGETQLGLGGTAS